MLKRIGLVCRSPLSVVVFGAALALVLGLAQDARASVNQQVGSNDLVVQAENCTVSNGTAQIWQGIADPTAYGGYALMATTAGGTINWGAPAAGDYTANPSTATYDLKFATAGTYYVYTRWRAQPDPNIAVNGANSAWLPTAFGVIPDGSQKTISNNLNDANAGGLAISTYDLTAANWAPESQAGLLAFTVNPGDVGNTLQFKVGPRESNWVVDEFIFSTSQSVPVPAMVPEPSTLVLLIGALAGLLGYVWRKRR
jgi:hypothetical protein